MCVLVVGGMDRLEDDYIKVANKMGIKLKVFTKRVTDFSSKIGEVDALIVFTNKVSHPAKNQVAKFSKKTNKPVFLCHSCGICSLKNALKELKYAIEQKR
ncbi:MAG: DUF2325 domain-containing protein [Desulfurella sp.]|uniref:DUF2325 domain-containing protein n=1 Tax=Desulfurella sp. TaxID=1962857 RepID=UPI003C72ADD8